MIHIDGSRHVAPYIEEARGESFDRRPEQRFDRLAFTVELLSLVNPQRVRVAVFRSPRLEIKQGRDLARGPDARWAMIGVPRDASAESIALALTAIEPHRSLPYALATLLEHVRLRTSAS